MKKFKFKKIDAFATVNSDGNPAGYIHLKSETDITEIEMQQIAKELKGFVNETGFAVQNSENEFTLKYFSSEREVDFCGHATIAIMYDLIRNDTNLQKFDFLKIKTNRGNLIVENRILKEDAVFIMSPAPVEKKVVLKKNDIAENLKIKTGDIDTDYPVSIINAGLTTLLLPVKNLETILDISPNEEDLKKFCIKSGLDIIEVFTNDTTSDSSDFRARVFAPTFGYIEDPATGSGNSAFGFYLLNNRMFEKQTITIEQNGLRDRFNIVKLQKKYEKNGNIKILFGGGAITRIDGEYILQ